MVVHSRVVIVLNSFLFFQRFPPLLPPHNRSERLAKKYWEKLFKEYCLVDLSRYKENKVQICCATRWIDFMFDLKKLWMSSVQSHV
ncbi:unnamed protein product [Trichobilharzia regenti]|nr:unnamed protein product [Trichobilharzia regenti]